MQDLAAGALRQEGIPLPPADLAQQAQGPGSSRTTLYSVRVEPGEQIRDTKGRRLRGNKWELAQ
jgi:hypothetical protein